jgi:hypothetical protein
LPGDAENRIEFNQNRTRHCPSFRNDSSYFVLLIASIIFN